MIDTDTQPAAPLRLRGIHKRYGGVRALRGAELEIPEPGTVLALCGENGCGKSTILKVLAGQVRPDAGQIEIDGEAVELANPQAAIRRGVVSVTQETTLAPDLSIAENIYLGHRMSKGRLGIDWKETFDRAGKLLARVGLALDPAAPVRTLRPDQQQMVEIVRALSIEARFLILDEPTSSLTDDEVDALVERVRRLKEDGVSTIFVSHRLDEVFRVADRIVVFRDGLTVAEGPASDFDRDSLIDAMVGKGHVAVSAREHVAFPSEPVLRVRGLGVRGVLRDVALDVAPGEIVGLAGLVGAGRSELLETIFGLHRRASGTIELDGRPFDCTGARQAIDCGLGFVPADRKRQGLLLGMSVRENLLMSCTARTGRARTPSRREEMAVVGESFSALRIKAHSPDVMVTTLSGGNQQKVVVGKWLATKPRVLLLDEPTRGVDIGAKTELHRLLIGAAEDGLGILVSSSETPELLAMCDRIAVMFRGEIRAVLDRSEATEASIAHYAAGHR